MTREESILDLEWLARFHALRIGRKIRGVADIEDAQQQSMLALIKAVDSWDESYNVPLCRYCSKKIKWALIDWLRTLKLRRRALSLDRLMDPGEDERGWEPTDPAASPEKLAIDSTLGDSLRILKPQERRVVIHRYVESMTLKETASTENIHRQRVKILLQISLRKLRQLQWIV